MTEEMELHSLVTGFWQARWNKNLWIQWPKDREATIADGFGWVTQAHVDEANRSAIAAAREVK